MVCVHQELGRSHDFRPIKSWDGRHYSVFNRTWGSIHTLPKSTPVRLVRRLFVLFLVAGSPVRGCSFILLFVPTQSKVFRPSTCTTLTCDHIHCSRVWRDASVR